MNHMAYHRNHYKVQEQIKAMIEIMKIKYTLLALAQQRRKRIQ